MTIKEAWELIAESFEKADYGDLEPCGLCFALLRLYNSEKITNGQYVAMEERLKEELEGSAIFEGGYLYPPARSACHLRKHDLLRAKLARRFAKESE